jgi:hypothetical protein
MTYFLIIQKKNINVRSSSCKVPDIFGRFEPNL